MPGSCCAIGFANRRKEKSSVNFFRIPSEKQFPERRKSWVASIKRKKWTDKMINSAKLCSEHFISCSLLFNFRLEQLNEYFKAFAKTFTWLIFQLLVRVLKI